MTGRTLCVKKLENPCDPEVQCEPGVTCPPITVDPDPLKLPAGGCTNPNSDLKMCAKQCDGVNYGRSMVSREMFRPVFESKNAPTISLIFDKNIDLKTSSVKTFGSTRLLVQMLDNMLRRVFNLCGHFKLHTFQ